MNVLNQISSAGLSLLKQHEGFRAYVYNDSAGHPTIGYGHKLLAGENFAGGITQEQGEALLRQDTEKAQRTVRDNVKVPLTQNQFDALTSLVYNIGVTAFAGSSLLGALNAGNYALASMKILDWKFAGGVPILLSRRMKEKALFDTVSA